MEPIRNSYLGGVANTWLVFQSKTFRESALWIWARTATCSVRAPRGQGGALENAATAATFANAEHLVMEFTHDEARARGELKLSVRVTGDTPRSGAA